jgi:hypothetical protein
MVETQIQISARSLAYYRMILLRYRELSVTSDHARGVPRHSEFGYYDASREFAFIHLGSERISPE